MKKNGKVAVVFAVVAVLFLCQVFTPVFAAGFSEASYVANKALPAVVLVYSVLEYSARVYIPWHTGAEEYIVSDYIASMGSGFFVNPNGYIVTNGHVVFCFESANYKDDIYTKRDILASATILLIDYVQNQLGISFTQDEIQIILNYNLQNGRVADSHRSVYVILGEATGNIIEIRAGYAASVVAASPFLGRDLAILKVELTNTPALLILESQDEVSVGDKVYALGYPGVATFHPLLSDKTVLDPSFTDGVVSAKRLTSEDVAAIQHSAATTHGNSGGPLVNGEGKVVGVNNMGSINELGLEVAGFNFAVAC
ncbi:MAG: S1C family serine protease, partial [Candidatus Bathyarchaeia archaeon]